MKTYDVTIRATVTKTLTIRAATEEEAIDEAHSEFTLVCDGGDEAYSEDVLDVAEAQPEEAQ